MELQNIIATIVIAVIINVLPGIIKFLTGKKSRNAESESTSVGTMTSVMNTIKDRVDVLDKEITKLRKQVTRYRRAQTKLLNGVNRLIAQLKEAGLEPVWIPDLPELNNIRKEA